MYINAPLIDVFPISKAREHFPTARALSEVNLVKWHRNICDKDSFVISKTFSTTEPFEFMIHGYYVKLFDSNKVTEKGSDITYNLDLSGFADGPIYAHIVLDLTNSTYPILFSSETVDPNNPEKIVFTGVYFSSNEELDANVIPEELLNTETYSLHILNKSGSTYQVPLDSLVKFVSTSLEGVIDGGLDNFEEA
jgi:hypothetical protein